jgi:hypothetical protein
VRGGTRIAELRAAAVAETGAVEALLDAGPATTWEVVDRRYLGREMGAGTRTLALRETLAHLQRLVRAGRARGDEGQDGAEAFRRS